jgi:hypothetical protein
VLQPEEQMRRTLGRALAQLGAQLRRPRHQTGSVGPPSKLEGEMASRHHDPRSIAVALRAPLQNYFCQLAAVGLTQHEEEILRLGEHAQARAGL